MTRYGFRTARFCITAFIVRFVLLISKVRLRIWYCALNNAELHIARVRARVARGGHDILETKIRERYDASRNNLFKLFPLLDELMLYDNSIEAYPNSGQSPRPVMLLHFRDAKIVHQVASMPKWAKPIAAVAMTLAIRGRSGA